MAFIVIKHNYNHQMSPTVSHSTSAHTTTETKYVADGHPIDISPYPLSTTTATKYFADGQPIDVSRYPRACRVYLGINPFSSSADFPAAMDQMRTPNTALETTSATE